MKGPGLLELDHLVVVAETLNAGNAWVQGRLGVKPQAGGRHEFMGTHNALLSLARHTYLEVIAVDPDAARPAGQRWFGLDDFRGPPRLAAWVCRSDDIAADLARAPAGTGRVVTAARGALRWQMAVPETGMTPFGGLSPWLIEWPSDTHPADRLDDQGIGLDMLEIRTSRALELGNSLQGMLEMDKIAIRPGAPTGLTATLTTPQGKAVLS